MDFISKLIKKKYYVNKGYGFEAVDNIPMNTILIKETPLIDINNIEIYDDSILQMFSIIYKVMKNTDTKDKFLKLVPDKLTDNKLIISYELLIKYINKLPETNFKKYFISLSKHDLLLYCLKYTRNAFNFTIYKNNIKFRTPVILTKGTIFNHSCVPNVIFFKKGHQMYFITTRDVNKGEELCDSYIDIKLNKSERQKLLFDQYGFKCQCNRCKNNDKLYNKTVNNIIKLKDHYIKKIK